MSEENFLYFDQTAAVGWIDMDTWDETHDAEASQGWCPAVIDTNGDGRITEWTEPDEAVDPSKDHRIQFGCYSVAVSHEDGSLWCSGIGRGDKRLVRIEKGSNPPETCTAECYEPPPDRMPDVIGSGRAASRSTRTGWPGRTGGSAATSPPSTAPCAIPSVTRWLPGRAVPKGGRTNAKTTPPTATPSSMRTRAIWRTWTSTMPWGSGPAPRSTAR